MKRFNSALLPVIIAGLIFTACGCIPLIIGGAAGALGAIAISRDTIQAEADKPYDRLWNSAIATARARGVIKEEDRGRGQLIYQESSSLVTVSIEQLTRSTVRLKVKARKHSLPNLDLAQEVFIKIMEGV